MMKKIEDFISSEIEYFDPMQKRSITATLEERKNWRKETIRERQQRISLEVFDLLGGVVKYGPFKGLKLEKNTWWGKLDLGSQCLGLYEKEILDKIDLINVNEYQTFIDIGAADGYYAVGMLTSQKVKKTICFEQASQGRETILSKWIANGSVGELAIYGEANAHSLSNIKPEDLQNAFAIIDIEGGEFDLLDYKILNILSSCLIFIEIHNWVDDFSNKYAAFLRNASTFFDVEIIQRKDRETTLFQELRDFTDDNRLLLTSERRPCLMRFLKLTPNNRFPIDRQ